MTEKILCAVKNFLRRQASIEGPLLLGLSGGPDSLALLHLLLKFELQIYIAHVDHGWREESACEARDLELLSKKMGLKFFCKKLSSDVWKGNLESVARDERLKFFRELYFKHGCHALVLGHHADDRSETVLKRVLEGAAMTNFASLSEESVIEDMIVWRPLLSVPKSSIISWLDKEKHFPFVDVTNFDTKFLRARMREEIIPQLSRNFGKGISKNLCFLGCEAEDLKKYLDRRIASCFENIESGALGYLLDLSEECPSEQVELKHLVRAFFSLVGERGLSRDLINNGCRFIYEGVANRRVSSCVIDRRRIFCPKNEGHWDVTMREVNSCKHSFKSGWHNAWNGVLSVALPCGDYVVDYLEGSGFPKLDRWWTKHKVPRFMRGIVPVVFEGKCVVHEFLTGKLTNKNHEGPWVKIELKYKS